MTTTANLGITKLNPGQAGAHAVVNTALDNVDKAIAGRLAIDLTGETSVTLTGPESTNHILHVTATDGACDLVVQALPKSWIVVNDGSHTVTCKRGGQASPTPPAVAAGTSAHLYCDGTNVRAVG
jgi:hypothetical protein